MSSLESIRSLDKLLSDMTKAVPSEEEFNDLERKGQMIRMKDVYLDDPKNSTFSLRVEEYQRNPAEILYSGEFEVRLEMGLFAEVFSSPHTNEKVIINVRSKLDEEQFTSYVSTV
jgi:hypothetical protein